MPLFEGVLENRSKTYDRLLPVEEITITFFDTDIDSARISLIKLCENVFPGLSIESVYETMRYVGSDPTVTDSHNKRS